MDCIETEKRIVKMKNEQRRIMERLIALNEADTAVITPILTRSLFHVYKIPQQNSCTS